jgi:4-hydroxybenzoate polyprenyltransferase
MLRYLLQAMRPKQWAKNIFVFAALLFDGRIGDVAALARSVLAFAIFCSLSSAIYLINDLADIENDRQHPKKRLRPLASGALRPSVARIASVIQIVLGLGLAAAFVPSLLPVAALYLVLMVLYTYRLKNVVIIDVMAVAAGFVLRVAAGAITVRHFWHSLSPLTNVATNSPCSIRKPANIAQYF